MVIDKKFKGLKDEGWRYVFNGDIDTEESLEIKLDKYLYVSGSIEAGRYIKSGGYIEAGRYIKADDESGIVAGLYIKCKTTLIFGLKCFAGICGWREIDNSEKTVTCGKFEGGTLEYGILNEIGLPKETEKGDTTSRSRHWHTRT